MNVTSAVIHTVDHIKRQAKKLKREKGIPHHEALDLASKAAGFSNWKHFLYSKQKESALNKTHVKTKPLPSPSTVSFRMVIGGKVIRPNVRMPVDAHLEVGAILDEVLAVAHRRKSVTSPLNYVRCELDDWVQNEYPRGSELSNEIFHKMYYGHQHELMREKFLCPDKGLALIDKLKRIKIVLSSHYHDCAPLKRLLKKNDTAIAALARWANLDSAA